jgi:hypothetical protein
MKFGRLYSMAIDGRTLDAAGNSVVHYVKFPLTCRFQIIKSSTISLGTATFRIYNLTREVRSDIYKDAFELLIYKRVTFAAGYAGEELPLIFRGNITMASSYREGPDWITEIQAIDGGWDIDNTVANLTKPAPYTKADVAHTIVNQMQHLTMGAVGDLDRSVPVPARGITLNGNAWDLITRSVTPDGGFAFINNEKVYIVNQWEYIQNDGLITEINANTGIIGTPRLQSNLVKVRMIYEPRIDVQQAVHLTTSESRMSGDYTVLRIVHQGTISGAVCDELITEATLFQPDRTAVEVAA